VWFAGAILAGYDAGRKAGEDLNVDAAANHGTDANVKKKIKINRTALRLLDTVVSLPFFKIDKNGLYLFGYRFASPLLAEKIKNDPNRSKVYKHFKFMWINVYKKVS